MNDNFTLTPAQQFDNICALRDYLKSEVKPANFNMRHFRADNRQFIKYYHNKDDCGTCGCALGWAPFVRELKPIISDYSENETLGVYLNFHIYCKRVFGFNEKHRNWRQLFDCNGITAQNTLQVVVKRFDNYILTTGSN